MDVILPLPESATGGIHPLTVPDPPKSPPTDHLPPTNGARAITDAFTRAMDLDVVDEESAIEFSEPRVQDEILVESAASSMRILDPGVDACQQPLHGLPAVPPNEGCAAAALLWRAVVMFTGGTDGPWSSGFGVASAKLTKGLVLAAAEAIEVGLGWLPKARPHAVTAACGQFDRREALAYLLGDVVLGVGLLPALAAREVGQAAGKLVWVQKGTPPLKQQVAAAKQAVQRGAAKLGLTPEQLAAEKAAAGAAVLHETCTLSLPATRDCLPLVAKEAMPIAALPPSVATPVAAGAAAATPSPATAAAATAPPAMSPPPAIAEALTDAAAASEPTAASPPNFIPHFAPVDAASLPDIHLPLVPWCDTSPYTMMTFQHDVCRARDERRTLQAVHAGAAAVGVHFYFADVVLADATPTIAVCAQPPPCPSDAVVFAHVMSALSELVWLVETGCCNFYTGSSCA